MQAQKAAAAARRARAAKKVEVDRQRAAEALGWEREWSRSRSLVGRADCPASPNNQGG
jgi:hypothetical protein